MTVRDPGDNDGGIVAVDVEQSGLPEPVVVPVGSAALPEPGRVFGGLPAVQGWKAASPPGGGPASYVLTVSGRGQRCGS